MSKLNAFALTVTLGVSHPVLAENVVVDSTAAIFDAGRLVPTSGLGGTLPPGILLPAGTGRYVEFSGVTGLIGFGMSNPPTPPTGPDGYTYPSGMDINSLNGISGMRGPRYAFLAGVFIEDSPPGGTEPNALDFGVIGFSFFSLSPVLHQTFYIGDGLTGTSTGTVQRFHAPDGATRLFLGILDAGGVVGDPGQYADNFGSFTTTVTTIPAPAAAITLFGMLTFNRRRTNRF